MNSDISNLPAARLIIGAMSGTSADGVDVAIVRVSDKSTELVLHHHEPYAAGLKDRIVKARAGGAISLRELCDLGRQISLVYAAGVNQSLAIAKLSPRDIAAIAAHGQTLFHDPPLTLQWLDPALLAARTDCAVVSDFRRADCAAGGQGAPLVPYADYVLFRHEKLARVLLNIGGIANITWLKAGGRPEDMIAFDTGPGNCLSDWLMRRHDPQGAGYDAGGQIALSGSVQESLVERTLAHPYFHRHPPKSTDGGEMIAAFRIAQLRTQDSAPSTLPDLLATAALITARSIADAAIVYHPDQLIASGGGVENAAIMRNLRRLLPSIEIRRADDFGIPGQAKEAIAFALLGAATLDGVPGNIPSATGAARAVVLGSVTPRPG
ncbi:MAG: anhydro-N-acetylmuramic acid kinase [Tepidisphaerales bacterium]